MNPSSKIPSPTSWHYVTPKKFKLYTHVFYLLEARRLSASFEGLNNSLSLSVGKLRLDESEPL